MNITFKNIPKDKISKAELKEVSIFILSKLIGESNLKINGHVKVNFRKLKIGHGGKANTSLYNPDNIYKVVINSYYSKHEILRVLAHELTHVKQYLFKELTYKRINGRVVRNWKGKDILRSKYFTSEWEVEARKNETLARDYIDNLKPSISLNPIESKIFNILSFSDVKNGDILQRIIENNPDKQYTIEVLKTLYRLREQKLIGSYSIDGVIYLRKNNK